MLKLATVEFPLLWKFDLVLLRKRPPSLPPTTIDTTAEPAPATPGLAKCSTALATVIPLRRAV